MSDRKVFSWRRALTDASQGPVIFLVAALLLGFSVNVLSGWIGSEGVWLRGGALLVVVLLLVFASRSPFVEAIWSRMAGEVRPRTRILSAVRPARGLVVVASHGKGIETAEAAIGHHAGRGLERVWILHSELSEPDGKGLRDKLVASGRFRLADVVLLALTNDDFERPQPVQEAVEAGVYGQLPEGWAEADVVLDLTAGRKTTTAGMFLAGLPGRRLELVQPRSVDERGVGQAPAEVPVEIEIDYEIRPARRAG